MGIYSLSLISRPIINLQFLFIAGHIENYNHTSKSVWNYSTDRGAGKWRVSCNQKGWLPTILNAYWIAESTSMFRWIFCFMYKFDWSRICSLYYWYYLIKWAYNVYAANLLFNIAPKIKEMNMVSECGINRCWS